MNIASVINFSLVGFNIGVMICAILNGSSMWWVNLLVAAFCFFMGIGAMD